MLGLLLLTAVAVVAMWGPVERAWAEVRYRRDLWLSYQTDTPPIRTTDVKAVQFPDPVHVRLPDGRIFRLVGVGCPSPGTGQYQAALRVLPETVAANMAFEFGVRPIGVNAAGESLAEFWVFQERTAWCGVVSRGEHPRRRFMPYWKNLGQLATEWAKLPPGGDESRPASPVR